MIAVLKLIDCLPELLPIPLKVPNQWRKVLIIVALLVSQLMPGLSQTLPQTNITIESGLINNEVTAIHQDSYGFMWFGTRGGLNRYNGYDFNIIRSNPGSRNNLSNQAVEVIAEHEHTLWIGNKTGGLNSYDLRSDSITHYNPPDSIKIQEIKSLLTNKNGDLFIGCLHGLYLLRGGQFYIIDKQLTVNALALDEEGDLWIGAVTGLFKYNKQAGNTEPVKLWAGVPDITAIAVLPATHTLVIGTWRLGLLCYDYVKKETKQYLSTNSHNGLLSDNVYRVLIDRNHTIWVGTWGGGISRFDPQAGTIEPIRIKPANIYNKDYDIILSLLQDKTGIIWVGTDGGGVCGLDPNRKQFNTISNQWSDKPLLQNTHITAVYEDTHGGLWLGTKGGGLTYSSDKKNFTAKALGFNTIRINTFFEDGQDLWVGTGNGLVIFRQYATRSTPIVLKWAPSDNTTLSGPKITSIVKDKNQIIWIGTQEHGLNRLIGYNNGVPQFKRYPEQVGVKGAIQNDRISCMLVDKTNRLWVGTYDGLHLYDREKDAFTVIGRKNDLSSSGTLSNNTILSLTEDNYGTIWVGTQQGLNRLRFSESGQLTIRPYFQCPGFPNDYIHAVLIDNENNVWMSTNRGITKFNTQSNTFRNFDTRDGISSNTFSENASCMKQDGEMFFGGINGVTYFYPDSIYLNHNKPPVYITGLRINNQDVKVGQSVKNDIILSRALFLTKRIHLTYRENIISISFAALDFHAPDKNQYEYKLEGFDDKWVPAGYNRAVTYTSLPSGTYTFKVRASNSDLIWNDSIATLQISISAPPWKTWWAYLLYFLLIAGLLYLSRHIKLSRIYLQNRLQIANLNYEKEREIAEIKGKFFTNISHEFRTPLTLMISPLEELASDSRLDRTVRATVSKIQHQSKRLLSLINQLLDFHKAASSTLQLNAAYHDIVAICRGVASSFDEEAVRKSIDFVFHSNERSLYLYVDREKIEIIIYNLLSNAFKFTDMGGNIRLALNYLPGPEPVCQILVSDTGKGISDQDKTKIFDRFYQVSQAEPGKYMGTGIGLAFVKDLVELHSGSIGLTDNQPCGSLFSISLPAEKIRRGDDLLPYNPEKEQGTDESEEKNDTAEKPILLVVEDNEELNAYLCSLLGRWGEVVSAHNGLEGMEKALQYIPDLVVSDVMMPEMDGYTLCKSIKEDNRTSHIPVILLTAKSDDSSQVEGIQLGADIYLGKPFKPAILLSHIKNLIKSRRKLKELFAQRLTLDPSEVEVSSFNEAFIKNAIRYVEDNIETDDLSIDDLAIQLNMSRSTFYRKLKALTGMSGSDFIRMIKLKRSAQLLKTGEYTVSMAAYNAGFNDLKHFRKSFQKQFGVTPSAYMKKKD